MSYEGLTLAKEEGVAILTLNRPEQLNAISIPMAYSLKRAVEDIDKDNSLKVLIITGAGRGFCAGLDVPTFSTVSKMTREELGEFMRTLTLPLYYFSKPTIAAINGVAVGLGLSIVMLSDIRIASEKAKFSVAHVKMGVVPDIATTYFLPRIIGTAKALEFMLTGDIFDAAQAQQIGLLNRVVPEGEVMKIARELADRLARGPSIAINMIKQAAYRGIHNTLEQQVELECVDNYICLRTEDHKEGVKSFFEKRPPEFKGK